MRAWVGPRLTDFPFRCQIEPTEFDPGPLAGCARSTWRTRVRRCRASGDSPRPRVAAGWETHELHCGHDMMLAAPDETADLLETIALGLSRPRPDGAAKSLPFCAGRATMSPPPPPPPPRSTHPRRRRARRSAVTRRLAERVVAWRWYIIAGWIVLALARVAGAVPHQLHLFGLRPAGLVPVDAGRGGRPQGLPVGGLGLGHHRRRRQGQLGAHRGRPAEDRCARHGANGDHIDSVRSVTTSPLFLSKNQKMQLVQVA